MRSIGPFHSVHCPLILAAIAAAVIVGPGCGSRASDGYSGPRGRVRGEVTFDSKPVPPGAQVLFMSGTGSFTATGLVETDGAYQLNYVVPAGLPVGEYFVQIAPPPDTLPASSSEDPSTIAQRMTLSAKSATEKPPFPKRFAAISTSGLTFVIAPGDNVANFTLVP